MLPATSSRVLHVKNKGTTMTLTAVFKKAENRLGIIPFFVMLILPTFFSAGAVLSEQEEDKEKSRIVLHKPIFNKSVEAFKGKPAVLETPRTSDEEDLMNLKAARKLIIN